MMLIYIIDLPIGKGNKGGSTVVKIWMEANKEFDKVLTLEIVLDVAR